MLWYFAALSYIALGLFSGFFAGLLGVGGGLVMVPALTMLFIAQVGFPADEVLHLALGTSVATIIFTSISSLRTHHQHQGVLWHVVKQITPSILIGTVLGTLIASHIPTRPLSIFFTCFVCVVALQMSLNLRPKAARELPKLFGMSCVGTVIGALSALVAIGGGSMTVPFLSWCNVRIQQAIGTSAAIGFPIAVGSTLGYIYNGLGHSDLPPWSVGFIYLPALICLIPASMMTAPIGARLAHRLPVAVLKKIFSALLVLLSVKMLWHLFG